MKRKTYSREFKLEGVRLSEESGLPLMDVANDLGIHPNTLYKWRKQLLDNGEEAFPGHGKMKESDEEARRLQRENMRLHEEREIFRKSTGLLQQRKQVRFRFIERHIQQFSVELMCKVLGVSRAGYYAWRKRRPGT